MENHKSEDTRIKVSILMPVYNVEAYLRQCLESVVKQSLKDIEIICVNDGSTDGSLEILKEYAKQDDRVILVDKENTGYGNTMNVALDHARGEYIGIVETDDFVETDMFEKLYETAKRYQADIVKSDHYEFSTKEGSKERKRIGICPEEYYLKVINAQSCHEIFDFSMMNWTGIYLRSFLYEKNIRHNETPGASFQDNGFWFQCMSQAGRIVFLPEAFYHYRQDNPNSSINSKEKVYCICEEYDFIRSCLLRDEKKAALYYLDYFRKKVFNYLHSYKRVARKYQIPFLSYIGPDLEKDLKSKYLKVEELDPWILEQANRIIDDPELYWVEDQEYTMRMEADKVHELLEKLRSSREFRKGIEIKKKLHLK